MDVRKFTPYDLMERESLCVVIFFFLVCMYRKIAMLGELYNFWRVPECHGIKNVLVIA